MKKYFYCVFVVSGFLWFITGHADARDKRWALLIGNQFGWKSDPKLKYIISGDLRPMEKELKKTGFRVILAQDHNADLLRKKLKTIQQLIIKQRVTTFLLYYSGHADKTYLHNGPKNRRPLSYKELAKFINNIRAQRRFVILDACFSGSIVYNQVGKPMLTKGERSRYQPGRNLLKHLPKNGLLTRGLQIISSSRGTSYYDQRRKASVFTYHLLQGLRGKADLNQDGKISMQELFNYAEPKVQKETGQSPQRYLAIAGGGAYGLVPLYRSKALFTSSITGIITISIDNFVWIKNKQSKKPLLLRVKEGKGKVHLQKGKICWEQETTFPAGGETKMQDTNSSSWTKTLCSRKWVGKGHILLPNILSHPKPNRGTLSLAGGFSRVGSGEFQTNHPFIEISFRAHLPYQLYFGVGLEYAIGAKPNSLALTTLHRLIPLKLGFGRYFPIRTWLRPFLGIYMHAGTLIPVYSDGSKVFAFFTGAGLSGGLDLSLSRRLGVRLQTEIGGELTGTSTKQPVSPSYKVSLSAYFTI